MYVFSKYIILGGMFQQSDTILIPKQWGSSIHNFWDLLYMRPNGMTHGNQILHDDQTI